MRIAAERLRELPIAQRFERLVKTLGAIRRLGGLPHSCAHFATVVDNLGEIARASARDDRVAPRQLVELVPLEAPVLGVLGISGIEPSTELHEQAIHAAIVELARNGRINRHLLVAHLLLRVIAAPLLAHIAQRVLLSRAPCEIEVVGRDERPAGENPVQSVTEQVPEGSTRDCGQNSA